MDLKKLSVLKEKLMTAEDFKEPWDYFFDHFGENPAFLKLGKKAKNSMLKAVITSIGQKVFQREDITVNHLLLTEINAHKFLHGAGFIQGRVVTLFFFKDIDMGLFAMAMGGAEISLARFTSLEIENGKDVFLAPSTSKAIN
ncbi:MAG: hypothetical protein DRR08_13885 [Candidatus Parabeggiatoa sp. nov. 2]|nr:MAG: hypothetical protein B6247_04990 [Beggiatoa sp. 4572_84]RKZ59469.1 MAG: hypothetical protein DRR08_13885 [Gammaproteobacteria bacterium]